MSRLLMVNQFAPPDESPTAALLGDLAENLRAAGWEVDFAHAGTDYRSRPRTRAGRYFREIVSLVRIFFSCLGGVRPDVVVSLTSPPCVVVAVALACKLRGACHCHWAMDFYPDVAVVLGEIREGVLTRAMRSACGSAYRACAAVVALDEDMRECFRKTGVDAEVCPPWFPGEVQRLPDVAPQRMWLYSGNLGRAHEWRTLLDAQRLLEDRDTGIRLVFQGGGAEVAAVKEAAGALDLHHCEWRAYAKREALVPGLMEAAVLVATQKLETRGFLWPSKLALAVQLGRPIAWVGPVDGAIAKWLGGCGAHGIFAPGDAGGLAGFILSRCCDPGEFESPGGVSGAREGGLRFWRELLERLG